MVRHKGVLVNSFNFVHNLTIVCDLSLHVYICVYKYMYMQMYKCVVYMYENTYGTGEMTQYFPVLAYLPKALSNSSSKDSDALF